MPEEPGPPGQIAGRRELLSRLRAVVEARDAENAVLRAGLDAERELRRRLERRLSMDSSDSGTPSSKERVGAKQARRARQQSERRGPQADEAAIRRVLEAVDAGALHAAVGSWLSGRVRAAAAQ